jgi:hypothetical protein
VTRSREGEIVEFDQRGPFVVSAVVCRETRDHDTGFDILGVLGSVTLKFTDLLSTMFIAMVVGGPKASTTTIAITVTLPGADALEIYRDTFLFDGTGEGKVARVPLNIPPDVEGTIWFDVYLDERLTTRSPFSVTRLLPD